MANETGSWRRFEERSAGDLRVGAFVIAALRLLRHLTWRIVLWKFSGILSSLLSFLSFFFFWGGEIGYRLGDGCAIKDFGKREENQSFTGVTHRPSSCIGLLDPRPQNKEPQDKTHLHRYMDRWPRDPIAPNIGLL